MILFFLISHDSVGLLRSLGRHLKIRSGDQGWTDRQLILGLMLLNLVGGDCVDDSDKLEADEGFCKKLRKVETHGLRQKERRELKKRWRKGREPDAAVGPCDFPVFGELS